MIPRDYGTEPEAVAQQESCLTMEVSTPQFLTGFKCRPGPPTGEDYLRMAVLGDMACDPAAGGFQPPVSASL